MTKFAYRLETKRVKNQHFQYIGMNLTNPQAVAEPAGLRKFRA